MSDSGEIYEWVRDGVSIACANLLYNKGIVRCDQLFALTRSEMEAWRNLGPKRRNAIGDFVDMWKMRLAQLGSKRHLTTPVKSTHGQQS